MTVVHRPLLSVVIPVMNEEGCLGVLLQRLRQTCDGLNADYEIIFVDDGSTDHTWKLIQEACQSDNRLKGLSLSRNFGHQNAIFAGLNVARGEAVVTMDGDLQHPPEVILELLKAWRQGYKIVETSRLDSRDTGLFKRLTSRLFYRFFSMLSGLPVARGLSDFRLIDRKVVDVVSQMRDADLFLRGFMHWVGFPKTTIPYQAGERQAGRSKFGLLKMIRFSISAVLSFSLVPLKLGIWFGIFTSAFAFLELLYILVRYLQGATVPGWASILGVISFMFGVLFIMLGIAGAYLGSIFETLKNRPRFIIGDTVGIEHDHPRF